MNGQDVNEEILRTRNEEIIKRHLEMYIYEKNLNTQKI